MTGFATNAFTLSAEERDAAAARAGLKRALAGSLSPARLAPLAVFSLALPAIAVAAMLGVLPRRAAELTLIAAAAAFMAHRLWTHRRLVTAKRSSAGLFGDLDGAQLRLSPQGFKLEAGNGARDIEYSAVGEIERIADLFLAWPRNGRPPLVWPVRAFDDEACAAEFFAEAKRRVRRPNQSY